MLLAITQYLWLICIIATIMALLPLVLWNIELFNIMNSNDIEKTAAYECGFEPFDLARSLIDVQFYIVAILFLVFDIEVIFLLPWAVCFPGLCELGFRSMFVFLTILILGLVYEIESGALNWTQHDTTVVTYPCMLFSIEDFTNPSSEIAVIIVQIPLLFIVALGFSSFSKRKEWYIPWLALIFTLLIYLPEMPRLLIKIYLGLVWPIYTLLLIYLNLSEYHALWRNRYKLSIAKRIGRLCYRVAFTYFWITCCQTYYYPAARIDQAIEDDTLSTWPNFVLKWADKLVQEATRPKSALMDDWVANKLTEEIYYNDLLRYYFLAPWAEITAYALTFLSIVYAICYVMYTLEKYKDAPSTSVDLYNLKIITFVRRHMPETYADVSEMITPLYAKARRSKYVSGMVIISEKIFKKIAEILAKCPIANLKILTNTSILVPILLWSPTIRAFMALHSYPVGVGSVLFLLIFLNFLMWIVYMTVKPHIQSKHEWISAFLLIRSILLVFAIIAVTLVYFIGLSDASHLMLPAFLLITLLIIPIIVLLDWYDSRNLRTRNSYNADDKTDKKTDKKTGHNLVLLIYIDFDTLESSIMFLYEMLQNFGVIFPAINSIVLAAFYILLMNTDLILWNLWLFLFSSIILIHFCLNRDLIMNAASIITFSNYSISGGLILYIIQIYFEAYLMPEFQTTLGSLKDLALKLGDFTTYLLVKNEFNRSLQFLLGFISLMAVQLSLLYLNAYENSSTYEYTFVLLTLIISLHYVVMAYNILALIIAIEVVSLSLFILIGQTRLGLEAALKYFAFSAFTTAFFLSALLLSYMLLLTLDYDSVWQVLISLYNWICDSIDLLMITAFLIGFFFKLAVFPCAMWAPDVYEGALNPVAFTVATVAKTGFFGGFVQLVVMKLETLLAIIQPILFVSIVGSLATGAFGALRQDNIKRFLAFTAMHHIGFILMALACDSTTVGVQYSTFYLVVYITALAGLFGFYLQISTAEGAQLAYFTDFALITSSQTYRINYYKLWMKTRTVISGLIVFLFSMAGIPPFAGFLGKYLIFILTIKKKFLALFAYSLFTSFISIFNYLRIIKILLYQSFDSKRHQERPIYETKSKSQNILRRLSLPFRWNSHENNVILVNIIWVFTVLQCVLIFWLLKVDILGIKIKSVIANITC